MKKKLYIGCALSDAPKEFVEKTLALKEILRKEYEVLDFVGLKDVEKVSEIYEHDAQCVRECDLMLAVCDYSSLGLGFEIGYALGAYKKVVAVAHKDAKVSRMILGITHPLFSFDRYDDLEDISNILRKCLIE